MPGPTVSRPPELFRCRARDRRRRQERAARSRQLTDPATDDGRKFATLQSLFGMLFGG